MKHYLWFLMNDYTLMAKKAKHEYDYNYYYNTLNTITFIVMLNLIIIIPLSLIGIKYVLDFLLILICKSNYISVLFILLLNFIGISILLYIGIFSHIKRCLVFIDALIHTSNSSLELNTNDEVIEYVKHNLRKDWEI